MGQRVVAVVQAEAGVAADSRLAEQLLGHCRDHLAGFKCPRELVFAAELPRLPSGKLLRRWVRDWLGPDPASPGPASPDRPRPDPASSRP
jgi:acyl-coenzyme A synthetase/AMP-(fatty) acid ligase